jgi:hypothetical protein
MLASRPLESPRHPSVRPVAHTCSMLQQGLEPRRYVGRRQAPASVSGLDAPVGSAALERPATIGTGRNAVDAVRDLVALECVKAVICLRSSSFGCRCAPYGGWTGAAA